MSGDDLPIDDRSATPLALLFHELATNAAKYGALSTDGGEILLEMQRMPDDQTYRMIWQEKGGPALDASRRVAGFGSKLMTLSVSGQMGGTLTPSFDANGLRVVIDLPIQNLTRNRDQRPD